MLNNIFLFSGRKKRAKTPNPIHLPNIIGPPPRILILPSALGVSNRPVTAKNNSKNDSPSSRIKIFFTSVKSNFSKIIRVKGIAIKTKLKIRKQRYLAKSTTKSEDFKILNKYQKSSEYYEKYSDYVISNNDTIEILKIRFNKLYSKFKE